MTIIDHSERNIRENDIYQQLIQRDNRHTTLRACASLYYL
jgi:hypothetical protein